MIERKVGKNWFLRRERRLKLITRLHPLPRMLWRGNRCKLKHSLLSLRHTFVFWSIQCSPSVPGVFYIAFITISWGNIGFLVSIKLCFRWNSYFIFLFIFSCVYFLINACLCWSLSKFWIIINHFQSRWFDNFPSLLFSGLKLTLGHYLLQWNPSLYLLLVWKDWQNSHIWLTLISWVI